ncbi:cell envelope integrity protein TolA [Klebsiella pneumoniae]|uniref:cell envelope integrity protein TolA n=1 Tax=Klebsiella pneumoniae TaxID=573 RepID=UPI000B9AC24A|nr:cell envelope integrity protein TolA [Klebsiella pneumoniae]MBX4830588.1 cell envelope integrity protein TolA [Klebsiella pneumoniae]HBQ5991068.1 cell envelope integrity protein TolA [Klebsiella pneumoniae subsp. pneumoniae]HBR6772833.1 cell envelope integrity protein TolA [Klebsiella pneumoniae]
MKKSLLAAALLAVAGSAFASDVTLADQARIEKAQAALAAAQEQLAADKAAEQTEAKSTSYSGASSAESSGYTRQVIYAIESNIPNLEQWKGSSCDVQIAIASDGTITGYLTGVGSSGLCSAVSGSLERMGKLPRPPSQGIYELMKNMNISLEIK